jgi:hypothetical protein
MAYNGCYIQLFILKYNFRIKNNIYIIKCKNKYSIFKTLLKYLLYIASN